jgi:predicted secreted hydrolase
VRGAFLQGVCRVRGLVFWLVNNDFASLEILVPGICVAASDFEVSSEISSKVLSLESFLCPSLFGDCETAKFCYDHSMKLFAAKWVPPFLLALMAGQAFAADWQLAVPGWRYEFPRDYFIHPDFKTEWWYFTGHLTDERGNRFGFELTFFRQGLRPPSTREGETSRFLVNDLKFAHFAITDLSAGQLHFQQKLSRGAFDEAGFAAVPPSAVSSSNSASFSPVSADSRESPVSQARLAWLEGWSLEWLGGEAFALHAKGEGTALDLHLTSSKPWVIEGENGVSQKADGAGHASHYYSGTRLASEGQISVGGKTMRVRGESWLDREWATNQLAPGQAGWNWFSIQLDDGTELMLYQMRKTDGTLDPNSSGTFIARDGSAEHLRREDYQLMADGFWTSPATQGRYPIAWRLSIPRLGVALRISTPLSNQELVFNPIVYWEGLIDVDGVRAGAKVRGQGYMELTGYAGRLSPLSSGE